MSERVYAYYLIETSYDLEQAALMMAGEQSVGTFVKVPGESPEMWERCGARVERVQELEQVSIPSLPGARHKDTRIKRAEVRLSFPLSTLGTSLTTLLTAVSGNLFELAPFSGLKLLDIEVPEAFKVHPGPQFGIEGTRTLAGVFERPLIGTIIKPSVGLSPTQTASLVKQLGEAGIDFIKDDELQSDSPHSPFTDRLETVMRVIDTLAEQTGKRVMYAINITGETEEMLRRQELVAKCGGSCVMVNMLMVGLSSLQTLRKYSQLPIHGHRAGWGALSRHPVLGMGYLAYQKFMRLAGVDHLHVNGLRNKFCEDDVSVMQSAQACLTPMLGGYRVMPVFSSGQTVWQVPDTYKGLQSSDCLYLAGGGLMAHPDGVAAGVRSLQEAWEAALQGLSLESYASSRPSLARAMEMFA
ncbi:MAG: ribulose 1,5-bisphosphate carboxylase [Chloroflexi bacterium AL-N5]|nr:ribulose 1,5-bisphosphate carboxylase [Chloroflexi bacterium AL-N5]